ncbi:MAG: hypothetical protein ACKOQY_02190 [Bacteroidota bacterium]
MFKRLLIVLLFLTGFSSSAQVPVLLRVLSAEQIDTLGFDVVKELSRIAYQEIRSGRAALWNTANKEIRILPQSLEAIERSSGTRFEDQERIFIYEFWTRTASGIMTNTTGFLFSNRNRFGEDVEYGFVECSELKSTLISEPVRVNVNGDVRLSLWTVLQQKRYRYNLLQFAGKVIDNTTDSRQVMNNFIGALPFNPETDPISPVMCKDLEWTLGYIRNPEGDKSKSGNALLKSLEQWLRTQEDLFVSLGGYDVLNRQARSTWSVNRIDVRERWSKSPAGQFSEIISLRIFINDSALNTLSREALNEAAITLNEQAFEAIISRHEFAYIIRNINGVSIQRSESFLYQKALEQAEWNKISDFVKEM